MAILADTMAQKEALDFAMRFRIYNDFANDFAKSSAIQMRSQKYLKTYKPTKE